MDLYNDVVVRILHTTLKDPLSPSLSLYRVKEITPRNSDFRLLIQPNRPFSNKRLLPGWDSMASNDHENVSVSSSPKYEIVKHVMIDIDEPEDLKTTEWNIYKVPCSLRSWKPEAYTPQLVSIGPLHYHPKKEFNPMPMQKQKLRYLDFFRGRIKNTPEAMDNFKRFLKDQVKDIRQCYAEKLCGKIHDEKLVDMMLLDSVFIMELFLRIQRQKSEEDRKDDELIDQTYSDDIILKQSWLNKIIQRDLLLLENQIPMFILKKLYKTVFPDTNPSKKRPSFIELAHNYFDCFHACKKGDCSKQETGSSNSNRCLFWDNKPQHFTDLIRYAFFNITTVYQHAIAVFKD
ncbi:uncharacterized protein LOC114743273 [Neltuma alba]|uniref:uncharacterized protein LOC114743273 n=1 Tax=Neltuma alba TaxID=207710 RepID=UPI0010A3BE59|nr:uncharacterized protein LOC114743273 [Prosopis alba]